jgi:hypothetical protein
MPFDEGRLWKGEGAVELKRQLQLTFQNITRVMDCVGCEKCKLWGKLQTLGGCACGQRDCQSRQPAVGTSHFGYDMPHGLREMQASGVSCKLWARYCCGSS